MTLTSSHCICVCRKYDQALEYHRQALVLIPQHASTYSAIGYVHSLMGDFESAIDYFHTVWSLLFGLHGYPHPFWTRQQKRGDLNLVSCLCSQALGLKRDDTFSVTMLGHCIEMYIGDTDAYIGRICLLFYLWLFVFFFFMFNENIQQANSPAHVFEQFSLNSPFGLVRPWCHRTISLLLIMYYFLRLLFFVLRNNVLVDKAGISDNNS